MKQDTEVEKLRDRIADLEYQVQYLIGSGREIPSVSPTVERVVKILHRRGGYVPTDEIINSLCYDRPDRQVSRKMVGVYISRLRKIMPAGSIENARGLGYILSSIGESWVIENTQMDDLLKRLEAHTEQSRERRRALDRLEQADRLCQAAIRDLQR